MLFRSAVLWTGVRSVVYVKQPGSDEPVFRMREVTLGPSLGDGWVVKAGLTDGEEIVTNGSFSVDAAAQLEGKPSMMNREGDSHEAAHDHSGMKMQEGSSASTADHSSRTAADSPAATGTGHPEEASGRKGSIKESGLMARQAEASVNIIHTDFRVEGLCEMCKDRIETTAMSVKGVESASWSIDNKMLHLAFNKSITSLETVQKAIAQAGHDNGKYKAPDEVYNSLPACCLYREGENR